MLRDAFMRNLSQIGQIDWAQIAAQTGFSPEQARLYAARAGVAFQDPAAGDWKPAEEYLSGNVRLKLQQAETVARQNPLYRYNIEALQAVQPRDLTPGEINAPLGAPWLPESDISDFAQDVLGLGVRAAYVSKLARWTVTPTTNFKQRGGRASRNNLQIWGSGGRADAVTLLEQALNGKEPTVKSGEQVDLDATYAARDKQQKIKIAFERWLWAEPARAGRLARRYNELFNATVPLRFDGSHLGERLPGMSAKYALRPHQRDAIWRLLRSDSNTLLNHATGAGKTIVMIGGTMELKRLGLRRQVMQVVPNNRLAQHARDFRQLYPGARLLVVSSADMSRANRAATLQRMAAWAGQGDAVLINHSAYEQIPVSSTTEAEILRQTLVEYDETLAELPARATRKRKQLLQARNRLAARLDRLEQCPPPQGTTWEDLGVDQLFIDEAHRYKNLEFATRCQNIAGIDPSGSVRAKDTYIKTQYLQRRCDRCGKYIGSGFCRYCGQELKRSRPNLCFATATPLDNSIAELYSLQKMLQGDRLKALGLERFDAWAAQFARPTAGMELDITGRGFKETTRLASFINVPDLTGMLAEVADVQLDPARLQLPLPALKNGKPTDIESPLTPWLQQYIQLCEQRAAAVRGRAVLPEVDNFLKIMTDLHLASLDPRLIDPTAPDAPDSKVNLLVADVLDTYRRTTGVTLPGVSGWRNLTQVVFLDTSTPKVGFNLYDDIKQKLVRAGVPPDEVVFIHDAKNDAAKEQIFEAVNEGRIRVLLASTAMAGEGANMQKLLFKLHHLETPWTPARLKQRNGRIVRQGNLNPQVEIARYVTAGPDAYRWQTVERKAKSVYQVLSGEAGRVIDDIGEDEASYAEIKAMAANNPLVKRRTELQLDLQKYRSLERVYNGRRFEAQQALVRTQAALSSLVVREQTEARAQLGEYRAILAQPFEYADRVGTIQAELNQIENEIAAMNRPTAKSGQSRIGASGGAAPKAARLAGRLAWQIGRSMLARQIGL